MPSTFVITSSKVDNNIFLPKLASLVVEQDREDRKPATEKIQQYDMNEFFQRILRVQKLNTSISNLLSRFHSGSSEDNSTVQNFAPPTHKNYQNIWILIHALKRFPLVLC